MGEEKCVHVWRRYFSGDSAHSGPSSWAWVCVKCGKHASVLCDELRNPDGETSYDPVCACTGAKVGIHARGDTFRHIMERLYEKWLEENCPTTTELNRENQYGTNPENAYITETEMNAVNGASVDYLDDNYPYLDGMEPRDDDDDGDGNRAVEALAEIVSKVRCASELHDLPEKLGKKLDREK